MARELGAACVHGPSKRDQTGRAATRVSPAWLAAPGPQTAGPPAAPTCAAGPRQRPSVARNLPPTWARRLSAGPRRATQPRPPQPALRVPLAPPAIRLASDVSWYEQA